MTSAGPDARPEARGFQWTLTLLPAFPVVLLVLRLWQLSRQDPNTMLLLVQNVSPVDLVSSLVIALMWVPPAVLLAGQALGLLYQVSRPDGRSSWLTRTADRTPNWAVAFTVMWAVLTWQLRFLPLLVMLSLAILALTVHKRHPDQPRLCRLASVWLPIAVAVVLLGWLLPGVVAAFAGGEVVLALLLVVPLLAMPLLTGPLPDRGSRAVTHAPAAAGALAGPFVLIVIFLHTPVLPSIAVEVDRPAPDVVLGHAVNTDDTMTTLLDDTGTIRYVPNDSVVAKVLCGGAERPPASTVEVHGWHVEQAVLEWLLPNGEPHPPKDVRCSGRVG